MNTTRIICAGFGGQGIMMLGKILAAAGMKDGKRVSWMPSYGAEVRGGTAHSMVIISKEEIPSPVIDKADICIIMNRPSLDKFQPRVKKGGVIILNSSLIESQVKRKDISTVRIPATEIASSLGNIKVANIVALGALVSKTKVVSKGKIEPLLEEAFGKKACLPAGRDLIELNKKAFRKGLEFKE